MDQQQAEKWSRHLQKEVWEISPDIQIHSSKNISNKDSIGNSEETNYIVEETENKLSISESN